MAQNPRDIFICHASEDKNDVVRPMVEAFSQTGITSWYDEAEIQWGDSITAKVNEGLRISRYVVVVLSPASLAKNWPQRELNATLNQEASSGEVRVLPLLVGTPSERHQIIETYPLLNDKRYLSWDGNPQNVVDAMLSRLGRKDDSSGNRTSAQGKSRSSIPLPSVRKQFTQYDRDMFLHNSFAVVKQYFQEGLAELEHRDQQVKTRFEGIHAYKFRSTVYVRGDMAHQCMIWIGSFGGSSESIMYQSGRVSIDSDHSFNDQLTVAHDEQHLGFKLLTFQLFGHEYSEKTLLSAEQAAEYLWRRFTDNLK